MPTAILSIILLMWNAMVELKIPKEELTEAITKAAEYAKEKGLALSQHGLKTLAGVSAGLRKAGAILTLAQETELTDVLKTLPETCQVTSLKRGGLLKKHIDIGIRCRDDETEDFTIYIE